MTRCVFMLTYQYSGRKFRLTDLGGSVAKDVSHNSLISWPP